jgi:hypothetical protein
MGGYALDSRDAPALPPELDAFGGRTAASHAGAVGPVGGFLDERGLEALAAHRARLADRSGLVIRRPLAPRLPSCWLSCLFTSFRVFLLGV